MRNVLKSGLFVSMLCAVGAACAANQPMHNVASLHAGGSFPDSSDFGSAYRMGFCASLDYATRLGRESKWFAFGTLGYNTFQPKEGDERTYIGNFDADARWYFGVPGVKTSGYLGLGPGVYWNKDGDVKVGADIAVGGDFPVGNNWSILADIDQHLINDEGGTAFLTLKVGAAYWFR